jgi:hypothetical protein
MAPVTESGEKTNLIREVKLRRKHVYVIGEC